MSSAVVSFPVLSSSGYLLRRSKIHQALGFSNYYSSSYGRTSVQFSVHSRIHLPHHMWANKSRFTSFLKNDSFSLTQIKMCGLSSWSNDSIIGQFSIVKRPFVGGTNTFKFPYSLSIMFKDISIAQNESIRFINSHRRSSKISEVFGRRETQIQGKYVRNSRRSSEKAGEKSALHENSSQPPLPEGPEKEEKKLTLYQRFKQTYKEHGKVLVAVHVATSLVWFGSFYTAASLGFDIVPLLESWNMSERIISPFRSGGLGNVALAYLLYKLATPARYTVTIAGTNFAIKYLQKEGKMKVVPKADSLRSLYKEGKEDIKGRSKRRMTMIRRRARRKQRSNHEENNDKP